MKYLIRILFSAFIFTAANSLVIGNLVGVRFLLPLMIPFYLLICFLPSIHNRKLQTKELRNSADGCELLYIFLISTVLSLLLTIPGWFGAYSIGNLIESPRFWVIHTLVVILLEAGIFWNGITRIYLTSTQLGIKWRVIGGICGMIPIINLIVLSKMLLIVQNEIQLENEKILKNAERAEKQICRTKYPILMVHGVFFRDLRQFNYWGRIPGELEKNGAVIYYGNHPSASSVKDSAKDLDARIRKIVADSGCEKVNVIAHSKGGLDMRYALSKLGTDQFVASLTTINTPHRGCEFADYLLTKVPPVQKEMIAATYNKALHKLGDADPDFIAAVSDLTATVCTARNNELPDSPRVYYQSVGSKLNAASGGRFPLNFTYDMVKFFDGINDGLVGEKSFPWGDSFQLVTSTGKRGVSHADMIDLNRENFEGFDVREFFVTLVQDLKNRGF